MACSQPLVPHRQLDKRFISLQALVHIREKTVKEKEDQVADIQARLAEEAEEARAARTAIAASASGKASPRWGLYFFMVFWFERDTSGLLSVSLH